MTRSQYGGLRRCFAVPRTSMAPSCGSHSVELLSCGLLAVLAHTRSSGIRARKPSSPGMLHAYRRRNVASLDLSTRQASCRTCNIIHRLRGNDSTAQNESEGLFCVFLQACTYFRCLAAWSMPVPRSRAMAVHFAGDHKRPCWERSAGLGWGSLQNSVDKGRLQVVAQVAILRDLVPKYLTYNNSVGFCPASPHLLCIDLSFLWCIAKRCKDAAP